MTARLVISAVVLLQVQACATRQQPPPTQPPHTNNSPVSEPPPAGEPMPEPLRRLEASVDALAPPLAHPPPQAGTARVLRDLADALPPTPAGLDRTPLELREMARRLEATPPESLAHDALVVEALAAALRSLVVRPAPLTRAPEYRHAVAIIRRRIDDLNRRLPLLERQRAATAAFRAVTDAVFLARGREPPFDEAKVDARRGSTGSTGNEIDEARADVLALGRSRWPTVRWAAARALSSIADIIEARDHRGRQADEVSKIRFQMERLRSADAPIFVEAGWVKTGLTAALDALDALQVDGREWTRAARRAVDAIEDDVSLTFQRAAVQDGFRATVDAFAATLL